MRNEGIELRPQDVGLEQERMANRLAQFRGGGVTFDLVEGNVRVARAWVRRTVKYVRVSSSMKPSRASMAPMGSPMIDGANSSVSEDATTPDQPVRAPAWCSR